MQDKIFYTKKLDNVSDHIGRIDFHLSCRDFVEKSPLELLTKKKQLVKEKRKIKRKLKNSIKGEPKNSHIEYILSK